MNIIQIEYNLTFILDELRKRNQEDIKTKCLQFIHRNSMYYIGNRNYLQQYKENKITIFGLLDQLVSDFCNTLTQQNVPAVTPGMMTQRSMVCELVTELSLITYGN
jgi:hypothetical protein